MIAADEEWGEESNEQKWKKFFSVKILYMKNEKFRYENENFSVVLLFFVAFFARRWVKGIKNHFSLFLFFATVSRVLHSVYKIPFYCILMYSIGGISFSFWYIFVDIIEALWWKKNKINKTLTKKLLKIQLKIARCIC